MLQVDVVPGKGGDILAVRWLPLDLNLMWPSPWGLRPKGEPSTTTDSLIRFLDSYPGGWQTIFPNGGDACVDDGFEYGFHGEACLVPWNVEDFSADGETARLLMSAELPDSRFAMTKEVVVEHHRVTVSETARNLSDKDREVMWSHHPSFGPPFLDEGCIVGSDAKTFIVDDARETPAGDLMPGSEAKWPNAIARTGEPIDVASVPSGSSDRFGYLTDFDVPRMWVNNPTLGLTAEITWDLSIFPHAWFWLEKNATQGYPWFGKAFVLGLEPASSYPGQGIVNARAKTGTLIGFAANETRSTEVTLSVRALSAEDARQN